MDQSQYPRAYLEGVALFNQREFFECHEVWEDLWRETAGAPRQFYKGLIQAAVALLHLSEGNLVGARKLLSGARRYLTPFGPQHLGLDVAVFLDELSACFQGLPPESQRIDKTRLPPLEFPRILLHPPME